MVRSAAVAAMACLACGDVSPVSPSTTHLNPDDGPVLEARCGPEVFQWTGTARVPVRGFPLRALNFGRIEDPAPRAGQWVAKVQSDKKAEIRVEVYRSQVPSWDMSAEDFYQEGLPLIQSAVVQTPVPGTGVAESNRPQLCWSGQAGDTFLVKLSSESQTTAEVAVRQP